MNKLANICTTLDWGKRLGRCLCATRHLQHLIALAVMTAVAAGILLFLVDPNIKSPLDGMWSAWVTMTHVGFGDVVPTSFFGRLLAAGLILLGLALLSLFTALVSVALIGNAEALSGGEQCPNPNNDALILAELSRLHERMSALERQLSERTAAPSASGGDRL